MPDRAVPLGAGEGAWFEIRGRSALKDYWVTPAWEGKSRLGPWLLDDGREITDLIADGRLRELGFAVWFEPQESCRAQRMGDVLWSGGALRVVSDRFVAALRALGVEDVETFEIDLRTRKQQRVAGYVGCVEPVGRGEVRAGLPDGRNLSLLISERVLEGLRAQGVTEYEVAPGALRPEPFDWEQFWADGPGGTVDAGADLDLSPE